jgi:transcriptional regulator with XRE-family HTH domain
MNADISERIKNLRKEKNLNQEELGKILGISRRSISAIENGETDLSTQQIKAISELFNVTTDYLLNGTEIKNTISETEQEIIQLVRKDADIKATLLNLLDFKKKTISRMMMKHELNHELMAA